MRCLVLVLFALLLVPSVHAANLDNWNIEISLNDDRTSEWIVTLVYDDNITRNDYFVLTDRITGLEVITDGNFIDCQVSRQGLGTSILCDNIRAHEIQYSFRVHGLIESNENLEIFKYRFSLTQRPGNFSISVKLPLGAGLVEDSKLIDTGLKKFEPEWGKEGSDGRRIFFEWKNEDPKLGEAINVSIVYEQVAGLSYLVYFAVIFVITAVSLLYLLMFRRRNIKSILPVLTDGERKVMEILLREKKDVDQRKIVNETDFSKAKVSRIIQNLVNSKLIEKIHKGRNNLIKLKK
ncbi:MAG: hypothetical protein NT129_03615 [Candidatus Aenigmarchaeota archaeon]|nr:hypothetical protein [Candidatus Aenigmarchaeota archaeon]